MRDPHSGWFYGVRRPMCTLLLQNEQSDPRLSPRVLIPQLRHVNYDREQARAVGQWGPKEITPISAALTSISRPSTDARTNLASQTSISKGMLEGSLETKPSTKTEHLEFGRQESLVRPISRAHELCPLAKVAFRSLLLNAAQEHGYGCLASWATGGKQASELRSCSMRAQGTDFLDPWTRAHVAEAGFLASQSWGDEVRS
ncbi:hypothetical protein B0I35DRAFT_18051 [Stachybotrys elegans]|uniref:Uncharacterized protein n=1 Tax=Stachybotrys elegans TaxID=80388 RepID=A0A8K0T407_9HYPO|nr:hypothetical protein B0I35DRAFT_18051 [Stachybotrys elegans]